MPDDMKLTSLKLTKKDREKPKDACCPSTEDGERYPWGTDMRFEEQIVKRFPELQDAQAGDMVSLYVKAKIARVESIDTDKGKKRTVTLQPEGIAFENDASDQRAFNSEAERD